MEGGNTGIICSCNLLLLLSVGICPHIPILGEWAEREEKQTEEQEKLPLEVFPWDFSWKWEVSWGSIVISIDVNGIDSERHLLEGQWASLDS